MKKNLKELFKLNKKVSASILSLIYTLLLIFGTSYMKVGNASQVFNNKIISFICLIFIFLIVRLLLITIFNVLDKKTNKEKDSRLKSIFDKHPFLISLIVILILWIPYIIAFYPAILSPDPSFQIKQFFGIPNKYSFYVVLLDKNVLITNHHPVLHTLLLGSSLNIGHILGNDNFGLFLYSIIQILILSSVLAFTISYMKSRKVSFKYRLVVLTIYGLVPMFPLYSMSAVKDVIFTSLIILYDILIYHLIKIKNINLNILKLGGILLLLIFILLFRNNGFHVVLLSFPFVVLFCKKNFKKLLLVFILFICFNYAYNNILLPKFKITPTSIREVLSIPFQQTARYVKNHDLTSDEYKTYDKILGLDNLSERYNPETSDPVKNGFNRYATDEDLKRYFKVWYKDFKKDPVLYIDATINNTYGYFYPLKNRWYVYYKYNSTITEDGFNYHYNGFNGLRGALSKYSDIFRQIPIIGLISNIGFNTWVLMFMVGYYIYKKKYRDIIYLIPSYVILLVCIASPVNAYFRYAMPYVFAMPLLLGLFKERSECNEKK